MKVGVLLGDKLPAEGGGYTFEHDILQALIKLEAATDHTFVVLTQAKTASPQLTASSIEVQSLYRSWLCRAAGQWCQMIRALAQQCRRPGSPFHISHWTEPEILRSGVDVIWHLTPTWLTAEVPAIIVVWELQHRLQPYFPEMSAQGEWDERDRSYGTILRRAAYVIAGTEAGQAEIERFYQVAPERIKRLPHPTPRYALEAPPGDGHEILEKFRIPSGYIFYPAQFWAHKNHTNLLLALRWLRDEAELELPLVLAGSDKGNEAYLKWLHCNGQFGKRVSSNEVRSRP